MTQSIFKPANLLVFLLILFPALTAGSDELPEGKIAFYRESSQGKGNLFILDIKSGKQRQIGQSGSRSDHFPCWSADGSKIVFESYRKGGWHVWVSLADGSQARRLSNLPDYRTNAYEFDPAFAPDNQTVVFMKGDDLWTVTLDTPTPSRITPLNNNVWETAPSVSPDGKKIAISGYSEKKQEWQIYTLNMDGSRFRQLTDNSGNNFAPAWSPGGQHILFYSDHAGSFELYELSSDGQNARAIFDQDQLTAAGFERTELINPWDNNRGATEQYRADYSPDGQWIVFSRDIKGDRELFIARRDGTRITRITHRNGLDGQPAWQPK